mmetsp:Transcript_4780/g.8686  ORF Transcript_4780/g.8686 Transcript_4780/m.8686 type:complete len:149 (-) Transcript_4780:449-895(-)
MNKPHYCVVVVEARPYFALVESPTIVTGASCFCYSCWNVVMYAFIHHAMFSSITVFTFALAEVMLVLRISEQLVAEGKTATQRDIFYRLKSLFPVFKTPDQVNDAIVAAAKFLNTPRYTLGFICSSRGAAAGSLIIEVRLLHCDSTRD